MANTVLTLGDITFSGMEIPESLPFGGEQRLAIKKLVGGTRVIDALGPDPAPIGWSGLLLGTNAIDRATSLDQWRKDGQSATLTWSTFRYEVMVKSFTGIFDAPFRIPYQIVCEVISDGADSTNTTTDLDGAISTDMTSATSLASTVGDSTLSSLTSTLSSAVSAVSSFAKATTATISSVLAPLNAARAQAQLLIASTENTLKTVTTVGGLLPNNPIATNVAKLTTQVNTSLSATALYKYDSTLSRMATNLGQVSSGVTSITVAGGNLYSLASKYYGDATAWASIAKANGLTDPEVSGVKTLVIPANTNSNGGILSA